MEKLDKEKKEGITLVSLVITIIILLILAGVTVAALTGDNGTVNMTLKAHNDYEKTTYEERIEFAKMNVIAEISQKFTLDRWIEEIYKEKIVPENSITKISDKAAKVVTPEKYEIIIGDYDENDLEDDDEPEGPIIIQGENEIIIDDVEIEILGDIEKDISSPEYQYGKNYSQGQIFKYNNEYYIFKYNQYLTADNCEQMIQSKNGILKINVEKGFLTPSETTVEGDMQYKDDKVYVYAPYGDNEDGWTYADWWIEVTKP